MSNKRDHWLADAVVLAIGALAGLAAPQSDLQPAPRQRKRRCLKTATRLATIAAAIAAAAAAATAAMLTRQTMVASNRAWIEPSELRILSGLRPGEPLSYSLNYANIGKEPALNVVIQSYPGTVEPRPHNDLWYARFPGRNKTCVTAQPTDRGLVVYPSNTPKHETTYTSDEPPPDSEAVLAGDKVLVIEGCIGYETFGEPHFSAFCFFLPPVKGKSPDQWPVLLCPTHNYAT